MDNVELSSGADGGGLNPYQKLLSIPLLIPFDFENRAVSICFRARSSARRCRATRTQNSLDKSDLFLFTARCFVGIHYKVSCMGLISALPVLYHLDEPLDRRLDMARISEKSSFRRVMFKQTQSLFRSRLGFTCLRCVIRESTLTSSRTRTEFSSLLIFTLNPIRGYNL